MFDLIMRTQKTSRETNKNKQITGDPKLKMNDLFSLETENLSIKIQLYEHKLSL